MTNTTRETASAGIRYEDPSIKSTDTAEFSFDVVSAEDGGICESETYSRSFGWACKRAFALLRSPDYTAARVDIYADGERVAIVSWS